MIIQALNGINGQWNQSRPTIILRCPSCRQLGTFDVIGQFDALAQHPQGGYTTGQRICPNPACKTVVFFVWNGSTSKLEISYPPERLDFDSTNIPASITKALEEAITCHSTECYILRQKIDEGREKRLLKTVHGYGYKIEG
jgi:hypothetical protein